MSNVPGSRAVTDEMLEAASRWRQRMEAVAWSADDEAALEVWLQADERHASAFEAIGDVRAFFEGEAAAPELIALRRATLGRFQRQMASRFRPIGWGAHSRRAMVACGVAAVLGSAALLPVVTSGHVYSTGLGERRAIILDDGSVLSLDAMTSVSVRYSDSERRLVLRRGQARFDVAHDPSKPFSVVARDRKVIATGTAFNIDMVSPEVRVTLLKGRVLVVPAGRLAVNPQRRAERPIELHPGQALVAVSSRSGSVVAPANLNEVTAWQEGQLFFEKEPLGEAVERVNRYTNRKIVVADAEAAALPISGAFNAGDVKTFLEALDGFLPVTATYEPDRIVLHSIQGEATR